MKIRNSLRTRKGLKLLAKLVREGAIFAVAVVDGWSGKEAKELNRALKYIDQMEVVRKARVKA